MLRCSLSLTHNRDCQRHMISIGNISFTVAPTNSVVYLTESTDLVSFVNLAFCARRHRCRQIPTFCDDVDWPVLKWEMLFDQNGDPLSGVEQENSWFYTPPGREGDSAHGILIFGCATWG